MKYFVFFSIVLTSFLSNAQVNLVPNPSFEDTTNCPGFWNNTGLPWYSPSLATSDYFYGLTPSCGYSALANQSGFQMPRTGLGYAGIFLWTGPTRDYLQCKLDSDLVQGVVYTLKLYLSRANYYDLATDAFGVYFSPNPSFDSTYYILGVTPQITNTTGNLLSDSSNWILFTGHYTSLGGERYITIGNFLDDQNTVLVDVDSSPNSDNHNVYMYVDDVSLERDSVQFVNETHYTSLQVYPNPAHEFITISINKIDFSRIRIISSLGELVYSYEGNLRNDIRINVSNFESGLYKLIINTNTSKISKSFIKY